MCLDGGLGLSYFIEREGRAERPYSRSAWLVRWRISSSLNGMECSDMCSVVNGLEEESAMAEMGEERRK